VAETVVGRLSGRISGHFGPSMSTPAALNDSVEHVDRLSSHQNRSCSGFGRGATESTPTARDFISSQMITWAFLRLIAVKTVWQG
jgi:hypothetical protein